MLRFWGWIFTLLFIGALAAGAVVVGILYHFGRGLPDYEHLRTYEPPIVSRIYANDGRLFAEYASQKRVFVPIASIPKRVIKTFLAAEDKNFYHHPGLDFPGIIRAAITNLKNMGTGRRPMGASTITQQVAKNLLLADIGGIASYDRKVKEAILTMRIENAFSKDRILELYLNEIYLGDGTYGVAAAALHYFNKSMDELTIAECAFLAALPKAPSHYHPKRNYAQAKARRDWVISRMYEEGLISREEAIQAKNEPFNLREQNGTDVVQADYFAEDVRRHMLSEYGAKALYEGGYTIRTTLDPVYQEIAEKSLREGLITYDRRHGYRGPIGHLNLKADESWTDALKTIPQPPGIGHWKVAVVLAVTDGSADIGFVEGGKGVLPLVEVLWASKDLLNGSTGAPVGRIQDVFKVGDVILVAETETEGKYSLQQIPAVTGALVAMDAYTGRVLAMSGGWSYQLSQFNCATQANRQPGSAIKPFTYLTAMEMGYTPSTIVSDSPVYIRLGQGLGVYSPKNVTPRYYGPVPMRIGLQKSLNMLTVRLAHEYVGMNPIIETIQNFGITKHLPKQLAMVLGAGETTVLKLTNAYAILANGGRKVEATLIDRIQDRTGHTVFRADQRVCPSCTSDWTGQEAPEIFDKRPYLVDPRSAYQVTSMLEGAVRNGSAVRSKSIDKVVAVKTGTTNEERDTWTMGYTATGLVVGVFVGFPIPRHLGHKEQGAKVAQPIFIDFMKQALKDTPSIPFKTPPGIRMVRYNEMTGKPAKPGDANIIWEVFKADETPRPIPERATFGKANLNPGAAPTEVSAGAGDSYDGDSGGTDMIPTITQPEVAGTGGLY